MTSYLREIPRYRCHKEVGALRIKYIIANPRGFELHFEDERFAPHQVDAAWVQKHAPQTGGFFVVYGDGYQSYSPAKAFEEGYSALEGRSTHDEDYLEKLFWEFDAERKKGGQERLNFKGFLRAYAMVFSADQLAADEDRYLGELVRNAAQAGLRPFVGHTFASATSLKMHNHEVRHDGTLPGMIRALEKAVALARETPPA